MKLSIARLRRIIKEAVEDSQLEGLWLVRQFSEKSQEAWTYGPIEAASEDEAYEQAESLLASGEVAKLAASRLVVRPLSSFVKSGSIDVDALRRDLEELNDLRVKAAEIEKKLASMLRS